MNHCENEMLPPLIGFVDATKEEIRAAIRFSVLVGDDGELIQDRIQRAYGTIAPCRKTVQHWIERFRKGRRSLVDDHRSGRPRIPNLEERVKQRIQEDKFISEHRMVKEWRFLLIPCVQK